MPISYNKGLELISLLATHNLHYNHVFEPSAEPFGFSTAFLEAGCSTYSVTTYDHNMTKIDRFKNLLNKYPKKFIDCGKAYNVLKPDSWVAHVLDCVLKSRSDLILLDLSLRNDGFLNKKAIKRHFEKGYKVLPHETVYDIPLSRIDQFRPYLLAYYNLFLKLPFGISCCFKVQDPYTLSFFKFLEVFSTIFETIRIIRLDSSNPLGREFYCYLSNRTDNLGAKIDSFYLSSWLSGVVNCVNHFIVSIISDPLYDKYKVISVNHDIMDRSGLSYFL